MAVPLTNISLRLHVIPELSLAPGASLKDCIAAAGKTGIWTKLSDFAGYVNTFIYATPDNVQVNDDPGSIEIILSTSGNWSIQSKTFWIWKVVPSTGIAGDTSVNLFYQLNSTGIPRVGSVVFLCDGLTETVLVTQGVLP